MNYGQNKIAKQAKKEYKEYHDNLHDEFFEKHKKNWLKLKEGKTFAEYFDRLKTYTHFKRKISKQLRKVGK